MRISEFPPHPGDHFDKFPTIARAVADRAVAWIDDLHSDFARSWAARRQISTRLVPVDPAIGLTEDHIHQFLQFAQELDESADPD
ncbi:hypothetical protein ABZ746_12660 [Streptomyces sp. NPDC020096]